MKFVILLTACINPDGMSFTKLTDSGERKRQYVDAVNFYLQHTKLPIVFAENSNTDISPLFTNEIKEKRLEVLTFYGNADKNRGKGFGEAEIIEYAINNAHYIDREACIIKITGRLIIKNIQSLVFQLELRILPTLSIICLFNSEFSTADSRLIIAPCSFYKLLTDNKNKIDDNNYIFFEHVLSNTIKGQKNYSYYPFIIDPQIIGISGSTGVEYSVEKKSFISNMSYLNYRLYQQIKLTNLFQLKKIHFVRRLLDLLAFSITKIIKVLWKNK